jgi:hypothetical protein
MVTLNNDNAMWRFHDPGAELHLYENSHFAAGQWIVRAVCSGPLGRPNGSAQIPHMRVLS